MFPIPFNFPFRKKNGDMTTIGDAISSGGSPYTLPTASAETKGGVKIGSGLTMSGEVLSVSGGGGGSIEYRAGVITEFNASANNTFYKDVTFSTPMPDTNYAALVTMGRGGSNPGNFHTPIAPLIVSSKTVNGFRIHGYNNDSEALNFVQLQWIAIATS